MEKKFFPEILSGERVILKKHEMDLAKTMFSLIDQDRKRLREFLPWVDPTTTVDDTVNYIKNTHEQWSFSGSFDYGIFRKSDNQFMGNIGVHTINWGHECCEVGYWIIKDFEGNGYITEAVKLLESAALVLGFHRVEIRCSSNNTKSAHVPVRGGYQLDGRLRENRVEHGHYADTLIFAKLL